MDRNKLGVSEFRLNRRRNMRSIADIKKRLRTLAKTNEEKEVINRITQIFDEQVSFEKAAELFEKLENKKWSFAKACLLYQSAITCGRCNRNPELRQDIEIALLCSSIEAMTETRSYVIFKDWLIQRKLQDFSMKKEKEIQSSLNRTYQEYVDTEPDREGAFYNFRKFLSENCPRNLKEAPIAIYDDKSKDFRQATFEESINYIYAKFRSIFLHRGIGRATYIAPKGLENAICLGNHLLNSYRKKGYRIDSRLVVMWFEKVVKESLWHYMSR